MLQCSAESWIGLQARSDKTNTSLVVKLKLQLEIENVLSGNDSVLKKQKLDGASAYMGSLSPHGYPGKTKIYIFDTFRYLSFTHTDFILYSGTIRYQNIIVFEKLMIAAGLNNRYSVYLCINIELNNGCTCSPW